MFSNLKATVCNIEVLVNTSFSMDCLGLKKKWRKIEDIYVYAYTAVAINGVVETHLQFFHIFMDIYEIIGEMTP